MRLFLFYSFILLGIFTCNQASNSSNDYQVPPLLKPPYLTVLGIAQDAGYPQANCQKSCCESVWKNPAEREMVSCLGLVDQKNHQFWLIDATPDFTQQLHILNTETEYGKFAGVFLTHGHIGHYTGLMYLGREVMGADSVPVYAMPRMRAFLSSNGPWDQLVKLSNIDLQPLADDSTIHLSDSIQITPLLVPHRDEYTETVGYHIIGPRKSVLFIPDIDKWQKWDQSIIEWIQKVDYALLDGSFFQNGEIPGRDMSQIPHPFIEESMALFEGLSTEDKEKVCFIHFNHTNPVLNLDSKERERVEANGFHIAVEGQFIFL
ncbi:MAG: MBL fold metallo-hydrolase [Bacteroidia bacterium]